MKKLGDWAIGRLNWLIGGKRPLKSNSIDQSNRTIQSPNRPISSPRVVPNRNTIGLLALLVAMWYAGASQNNGAAYLLCFVLAGVALVSILHTRANVRGLRISLAPIAPVFAGEKQRVRVGVLASKGGTHASIRIRAQKRGESVAFPEISGPQWQYDSLPIDATLRGHFDKVTLLISSLYPLGFFSAKMVVPMNASRWVYPAAEGARALPRSLARARQRGAGARAEGDDFAGLRAYVPGEPQRHIDWKAAARGQGLFVKQWAGEADETLHLDWQDTAGLAHEARLSQLARWIVTAARHGRSYALDLPGTVIPTGHGDAHFHQCLRALAVFPPEVSA